MKLVYINQPVSDLQAAVGFYRDVLGFEEAWREGEGTVSFHVPGRFAQVMLVSDGLPPGPMYQVDDADGWVAAHPDVPVRVPRLAIPGGAVIGLEGPGGNLFYVFDQPAA